MTATIEAPKKGKTKPRGGSRIHDKTASAGPIEPGKLYCLDLFLASVRWSTWAFRSARRNGLKVIRTGGHVYVRGDDALAYFNRLADQPQTSATQEVQPCP